MHRSLRLRSGGGSISFALGMPADEALDWLPVGDAAAALTSNAARQYGPAPATLKCGIARLQELRGIEADPDRTFVTSGSQHALSLIARLLLREGGCVFTTEFAYPNFHELARQCRVTVVPAVTTDVDLSALEEALTTHGRPALIYVMSLGHNPTGRSMSRAAIERIVGFAEDCGALVVDDDPYGLVSYTPERPSFVATGSDSVAGIGTLSKTLMPSLRTGWIDTSPALVSRLGAVREAAEIDTATVGHHLAASILDRIDIDRHVDRLAGFYR
ncbi:MAG: PLP-dependent aminotransferase family protein, partial [Actinomycetota bacterium]